MDRKQPIARTLTLNPVPTTLVPEFDLDQEAGGLPPPTKNVADYTDYKFLEFESTLRNICYDTFEPIRQRIIKETKAGKEAKN